MDAGTDTERPTDQPLFHLEIPLYHAVKIWEIYTLLPNRGYFVPPIYWSYMCAQLSHGWRSSLCFTARWCTRLCVTNRVDICYHIMPYHDTYTNLQASLLWSRNFRGPYGYCWYIYIFIYPSYYLLLEALTDWEKWKYFNLTGTWKYGSTEDPWVPVVVGLSTKMI